MNKKNESKLKCDERYKKFNSVDGSNFKMKRSKSEFNRSSTIM